MLPSSLTRDIQYRQEAAGIKPMKYNKPALKEREAWTGGWRTGREKRELDILGGVKISCCTDCFFGWSFEKHSQKESEAVLL